MTLRDRLAVPFPSSNLEWARWAQENDASNSQWIHDSGNQLGLYVRAHGYGVEIRFPDISVDFDWGDRGEAYGFDVWRLWNHCQTNRLFLDQVTYDLLKLRFEKACADGELVGDRLLHYLPDERTRFTGSEDRPDQP